MRTEAAVPPEKLALREGQRIAFEHFETFHAWRNDQSQCSFRFAADRSAIH